MHRKPLDQAVPMFGICLIYISRCAKYLHIYQHTEVSLESLANFIFALHAPKILYSYLGTADTLIYNLNIFPEFDLIASFQKSAPLLVQNLNLDLKSLDPSHLSY